MTDPQPAILLALGSINLDLQVRADRWPEAGESMLTSDMLRVGGGKAANRAVLARRLGAPARLIGRVGDDDFADEALRGPKSDGVDVTHVRRVPERSTAVAMIVVRSDGDKTILLAPNANMSWETGSTTSVADIIAAAPSGSVVTLDLEVPGDIVLAAAKAARARGLTVTVDPSPADEMQAALYEFIDVITPNPAEARTLTGVTVTDEDSATRAGHKLISRGVATACMKLPDGGCVLVRRDLTRRYAAPKSEVVDKTGAGDAFAGALATELVLGADLVTSVRSAVAAASLAVGKYGSQAAYPDRRALDGFLAGKVPA